MMSDCQYSVESRTAVEVTAAEAKFDLCKQSSASSAKRIVFRARDKSGPEKSASMNEEQVDPANLQSIRNFRNFPSKMNPPSGTTIPASTLFHLRGKSGYLPATVPGPLTVGETWGVVESALRGWPVRASGGEERRTADQYEAGAPAAL